MHPGVRHPESHPASIALCKLACRPRLGFIEPPKPERRINECRHSYLQESSVADLQGLDLKSKRCLPIPAGLRLASAEKQQVWHEMRERELFDERRCAR